MRFKDLVKSNRSYRRFDPSVRVDMETLNALVDLARHTASAANRQPLKYILCNDDQMNEKIFDCLAWAAYLTKWKGPKPGERPAAYIVILGDKSVSDNFWCDHGIAAQTLLLGAREKGLGGCMLAAINHKRLRPLLGISPDHEVLLVIALGKPAEEVVVEDVVDDDGESNGSIRYWRDDAGVHHVPKRSLDELIIQRVSH